MRLERAVLTPLIILIALAACRPTPLPATPSPAPTPTLSPSTSTPSPTEPAQAAPLEVEITEIPLSGPAASAAAQFSGMAWYGDHLILLPQYPDRMGDALYALPRADILAYLDGRQRDPLQPVVIPFTPSRPLDAIPGYEGLEAIAFVGNQFYVTIEVNEGAEMISHLMNGRMTPDLSHAALDAAGATLISPQASLDNMSDESLVVLDQSLYSIYEANGAAVNPSPVAHRFDLNLGPRSTAAFPTIEYRITDATPADEDGRFWAINYFFPGDTHLRPAADWLAEMYGEGATHAESPIVERLVEFQFAGDGIFVVDRPPIQLHLLPDEARNWEGIARLDDRGFLLVTDTFPRTILAFVAMP